MGRYVARRLLQFIPVLFGTMFLLHYLQVVSIQINGNPIAALFGDRQPPPETLAAITRAFGLDAPCLTQPGNPCLGLFVERLGNYAQGDFGVDFTLQPITSLLADAAPITIRLTLLAIIFESIVGIIPGVHRGHPPQRDRRQQHPVVHHAADLGADLRAGRAGADPVRALHRRVARATTGRRTG